MKTKEKYIESMNYLDTFRNMSHYKKNISEYVSELEKQNTELKKIVNECHEISSKTEPTIIDMHNIYKMTDVR